MTEEQTQPRVTNWMEEEKEALNELSNYDGEKLPALQFEESKTVEFTVDFSKKFDKYNDTVNNAVKAIIPVTHEDVRKILWLNVKNPLYGELITKGAEGKTTFKVMQVGNQKNTRYVLLKE